MSIWGNVDQGDLIWGLDYDHDPGDEPTLTIGVATTWHDHVRVAIRGDDVTKDHGEPGTILLPPQELRRLADRLLRAADIAAQRHEHEWIDDTRLESRHREYFCAGCSETKREPR